MTAFDNAKFFACDEPDELRHESPEEAIREYIDDLLGELRDVVEEHTPLTVMAYNPVAITPDHVSDIADDLAELVEEWLAQEFGEPDTGDIYVPDGVAEDLRLAFEAVIARVLREYDVQAWRCEKVGTREYSTDEVLAIVAEGEVVA